MRQSGQGTAWQPLRPAWCPTPDALAETLDGGQAFRWSLLNDGVWQGGWGRHHLQVRIHPSNGAVEWKPVGTIPPDAFPDAVVQRYFMAELPWAELVDRLPWRSDTVLRTAIEAWPGLRLLRQPFGETLLVFLCSPAKRIVQIKEGVRLLAERLGEVMPDGWSCLPSWERLADATVGELRRTGLGFRADHILETARFLARRPGWLEETESMPFDRARARLLELPGVGEKVADCVLLFGAGRWEAFPIDVWIGRILEERYGLAGWRPAQWAQFARLHFGSSAGLAQQFLFASARSGRMVNSS